MASPPFAHSPSATSPPANPSISKKRHGEMSAAPHNKRRKASTISLSHPLRQTSFPPEGSRRSPSVDAVSFVSGSQASVSGFPKKKRGRKSKRELAETTTTDVAPGGSVAPGSVIGEGSMVDGKESSKKHHEEEDDEKPPLMVRLDRSEGSKEAKQEENRLRGMLVEAFDQEQYNRYERWRAAKLQESTVRKVVNAAASQSAPPNAVLAVRSVTKMFMGDIIELARRIQTEWIESGTEPLLDLAPAPSTPHPNGDLVSPPHSVIGMDIEARRGPLRPEHLREAQRRYKLAHDGGAVGMTQPWHAQQQTGVERFSTRTGKRIFR